MKFKLGDRVKFISDNMEGVITEIKDKLYFVTIEEDFAIPTVASDLVKMEETQFHKKEISKAPAPKSNLIKIYSGIHIAFDRITENLLELRLHNSESNSIQYACFEKHHNQYVLIDKGELELEQNIPIKQYRMDETSKLPTLVFSINFLDLTCDSIKLPFLKELKISSKDFHHAYGQCYFLGKQAYHFRIDEVPVLPGIEKLLQKDFSESASHSSSSKSLPHSQDEIDIHIEKLVAQYAGLNPQQIVDIQIKSARDAIDCAYASGQKQLVIIHGVGNNWLKNKVNLMLKSHPKVKRFNKADMLKYGDGATLIIFD
jgi:hypothetical protein